MPMLELIIFAAIAFFVGRALLRLFDGPPVYCVTCGTTGRKKSRTRGSILIEIALWLFFIVPGVIYSLWRLTTRRNVCGACGSEQIIPSSSPRARAEAQRSTTRG